MILFEYIDLFIPDISKNVFSSCLIREIFRDNATLLNQIPIRLLKTLVKSID